MYFTAYVVIWDQRLENSFNPTYSFSAHVTDSMMMLIPPMNTGEVLVWLGEGVTQKG